MPGGRLDSLGSIPCSFVSLLALCVEDSSLAWSSVIKQGRLAPEPGSACLLSACLRSCFYLGSPQACRVSTLPSKSLPPTVRTSAFSGTGFVQCLHKSRVKQYFFSYLWILYKFSILGTDKLLLLFLSFNKSSL